MQILIKDYLIHSYLYYILDSSIISDGEYDMLCKELLQSDIEHPLVDKGSLAAGSGFSIIDYPVEIMEEAKELLKNAPQPARSAVHDYKPLVFTGHPMETYLLCGMYLDFGHARQRDRQDEIRVELQRRLTEETHREKIFKYFKDHRCNLEKFGLKEIQ
jgi:hypothetical protein